MPADERRDEATDLLPRRTGQEPVDRNRRAHRPTIRRTGRGNGTGEDQHKGGNTPIGKMTGPAGRTTINATGDTHPATTRLPRPKHDDGAGLHLHSHPTEEIETPRLDLARRRVRLAVQIAPVRAS